jgi:uncharacterized protein (UPF0264 family)
MTRLLVSVRDAAEAQVALDAGVHLIDVKEPARGSLGAADPGRIDEIIAAIDGRVPVSAALGELCETPKKSVSSSLQFAKWGLAGAADAESWADAWRAAIGTLGAATKPVAVQYADWQRARSPAPRELLAACRMHQVDTLLVDTYDKSRGGLLDVWPIDGLREFVAAARDTRMLIVLGGSLSIESLPDVLALQPDYVAVRGAACAGHRAGSLDPQRVRELVCIVCGA